MFDWSDIRIFLSVQRRGSFTAAASELHIDQTTVGRRVAALEVALGAKLFRRGRDGLALTTAGTEAMRLAEHIEEGAIALDRAIRGRDRTPSGPVRLTTIESFGARFLAPRIGTLRRDFPAITLEIHTDNRSLSLTRREADIAVRFAKPEQPGLVARKIGAIAYTLYATPKYLEARGLLDEEDADLAPHQILGFDEDLSFIPEAMWIRAHAGANFALRSNSAAVLERAAEAGLGVAVLPCYVGDARPGLVRAVPPERVFTREIWLLVHEELKDQARIRAVTDFVTREVKEEKSVLLGRANWSMQSRTPARRRSLG